jgi:hypothetical protein
MLNSSKEITTPQVLISPLTLFTSDTPFWLVFERQLIFNEKYFNIDIEPIKNSLPPTTNTTILGRIKFFHGVHLTLSYGALTSMNQYYYHPHYNFCKRTEWTVNLF